MAGLPHVLIIGGGFGGLAVAQGLRRAPVRVTLIDRSNHHLFQPLLYQVAMAAVSPADIAIPIRAVLRHQKNCAVLLGEVTGIDRESKTVDIDDGASSLSFDYLVVAGGAKTNFFGNDSWQGNALGLKSLDDAIEIRRRVLLAFEAAEREPDEETRRHLLTFVVIGGGPTGVEIAGGLAEVARFVLTDDFRNIRHEKPRIVLAEASDRLLPGLDVKLAAQAGRDLEALGVDVQLGAKIEQIDDHGVVMAGQRIDSPTVLWTAGVRARSLADKLQTDQDRAGRVIIEPDCTVKNESQIYVIGDMASFTPDAAERPLPGIAPVALQQGRHVARSVRRQIDGQTTQPFKYVDKGMMATIGRSRAVAQSGPMKLTGLPAWIAWLFIHIMYLVGFRNRVVVLFQWAWGYFTYKRGARLITGDAPWLGLRRISARARTEQTGENPDPDA